jgi:hypothetical protein
VAARRSEAFQELRLTLARPAPTLATFALLGEIAPLSKGVTSDYVPTRPLGGWLATYGKIAADGSIIPTRDREGHVFEAARTLGGIDFTDYLAKGLWNDSHQGYTKDTAHLPRIHVGVPRMLEFHDETTELAKAHRKVGFWTEGHLFDRRDPRSWSMFTNYEPTSQDLDRADYFWGLATMLKGLPRTLGFSAQGKLLLSPCGQRIIWAQVAQNAVCEMPQNPDTVAIPMNLAVPGGQIVTPDMVGRPPCADCRCPPGSRCKTVAGRKAATSGGGIQVGEFPVREDLEKPLRTAPEPEPEERYARLIQLLQQKGISEAHAKRWVAEWAAARKNSATT